MPYCNSCKKQLPEDAFKTIKDNISKVCAQCLSKRQIKYCSSKGEEPAAYDNHIKTPINDLPIHEELLQFCSSCKKHLMEDSFKIIQNALSKLCTKCSIQRKISYKNSKEKNKWQQEPSKAAQSTILSLVPTNKNSSVIQQNSSSDISQSPAMHIDNLSQFVQEFLDSDNFEGLELNVAFEIEESTETINQIAQKIREEIGNGDGYKWK